MEENSNFRNIIINSIYQLNAELDFFNQLCLKRRSFNKIIFCGMGGSALIGDLFSFLKTKGFSALNISAPIFIHRSYGLPPDIDTNTLVICVSYSGNTEEAISAFEAAKLKALEIAGVTSGGKLIDIFQTNKIPWIKIPSGIPPRCSLGFQLAAVAKLLMAYGLLPPYAKEEFRGLAENIKPLEIENEAKLLSPALRNKIPVIYSSENNKVLAKIWKIKFNENAKIPAFWNFFPELNHNEMNGWVKNLAPFHFLILNDKNDQPRIRERMNLTAELLRQKGLGINFIDLKGDDPLQELFWGLVYGDWLSYHLALYYGIDPLPVEMVEEFKKKLRT